MKLTRKFTIDPSPEQEQVLFELAETCRLLYNFALFERKFLYEEYELQITYQEQQNGLPNLKQRFPRYKQVYSKVLQLTLKKLDEAYKSFFGLLKNGDTAAGPPRYRGKQHFSTLCYNQSGFKFTPQTLTLSHKHPSKHKLEFAIPFDFTEEKVKQVDVFRDQRGRFWVAVVFEFAEPAYVDNGLYQAFDLGTDKHTAVNLHGEFIESKVKRPDTYWEPKLRSLQSRLDHCRKGSRRWYKLKKQFNNMKSKQANQTRDWQHKQALHLVQNTKANTLIVGDLSPKQMANTARQKAKKTSRASTKKQLSNKSQKGLNRGVHNTGHVGRFVEFLTYKAKKIGKKVIEIDERYTTMTCCVCGWRQEMPLWRREFICENPVGCSNTHGIDRDRHSSINIMTRFLSRNGLWTTYQLFAGNLRYTAEVSLPSSRRTRRKLPA